MKHEPSRREQGAGSRRSWRPAGRWAPEGTALCSLLLLGALQVGPVREVVGQDQPLNTGALFLVFPVGAYAVGMGQAGTAMDGRGDAAFWNPAGLATLETGEFVLHTGTLAAGRAHAVTAHFPSTSLGVFGGALYLVDYGDLEATDSLGNPIGRLSPRNFELLASYATHITGTFALGLSYKLVEFRADCSGDCGGTRGRGVTHAIDLGGQVAVGPTQALRLGVAVRHIGFDLQVQNKPQADPLPVRLVLGALYRLPLHPARDATGDERFDVQIGADVDSPWDGGGESEMRLGIDFGYHQLVRLRGGYAFVRDGLSGPSVGLGVASGSLRVDLARSFLTGSDLVVPNPTFFSFGVTFE